MIRRILAWLSLAILVVAAPADASPFRLHIRKASYSPPSIQTLSVAAGWNGTACSGFGATLSGSVCAGGSAPTDPTRTTAKPAIQWWAQDNQRLASNLVIGVDAEALGGLTSVKFYAENSTAVTVSSPSVLTDTDVNGNTRKRLGYWVNLNVLGAVAQHSAGNDMAIYAEAVPNDGTIQHRVIGPIIVHPEATASDFAKTICPSGCDYTTIKNALNAAQAASANAPEFTFTTTGTYEAEDGTWTARQTAKGFAVFKAAPGVTATIARTTGIPALEANWPWDPRWYGIEFRGSGVVLDFKYINGIQTAARDLWINGAKVTNSIGTRDSLYWNKGERPGGIPQGTAGFGYIDDAQIEYVPNACTFQRRCSNTTLKDIGAHLFSATAFWTGNYAKTMSSAYFANPVNAMSLSYTGAATVTVTKTGVADSVGGVLTITFNGTPVNIPLGKLPSDTNYNVSDVVNYINGTVATAHPGISATLIDDTRHAASLRALTSTSVTSSATTLVTFFDDHTDIYQSSSGGTGTRENVIARGNIVVGIDNVVQAYCSCVAGANIVLLLDGTGNNDQFFLNNYFDGGQSNYNNVMSHVVIRSNTFGSYGLAQDLSADAYTLVANNIVVDGLYNNGGDSTHYPTQGKFNTNGYLLVNFPGSPSGSNYVGNFTIGATASGDTGTTVRAAQFTNPATYDARPKSGSTVATTTKPKLDDYDVRLNPRASNDAVGAFALTAPAPSYPF